MKRITDFLFNYFGLDYDDIPVLIAMIFLITIFYGLFFGDFNNIFD